MKKKRRYAKCYFNDQEVHGPHLSTEKRIQINKQIYNFEKITDMF